MTEPSAVEVGLVRRWLLRGTWAITDQAIFAGTNLLLNVLLARWLTPYEYGAFAVMFSVFLLLGSAHGAVLTEPMLVYGSGKHRGNEPVYFGGVIVLHLMFLVPLCLLLSGVGLGFHQLRPTSLTLASMWLGVTAPFILFQWLMRRACYARMVPQIAAFAGLIYVVFSLGTLLIARQFGLLSAAAGLVAMAVGSACSSIYLMVVLGPFVMPKRSWSLLTKIWKEHWAFGRWSLGTSALVWLRGNIYYIVLPTLAGLEGVGVFRAMMNLIMPMLHVNSALATILLPGLVRLRQNPRFKVFVLKLIGAFTVPPAAYSLLLYVFGSTIMTWLYGAKYEAGSAILAIFGILPVFAGAAMILGSAFRAIEQPRREWVANLAATLVTLTIGLALVFVWGVVGAGAGWLCAYAVTASSLLWMFVGMKPEEVVNVTRA